MPTYEYECRQCSRTFEVRQRISEPALTTCEICGGAVRRLLSPTPFILKGGGWYVTDYPSDARKKALSSESADKPSASSDQKATPPASSSTTSSSGSAASSGGESGASSDSKSSSSS